MARPQTVTDDELLAAAAEAIGERGPEFTLQDVGRWAGVTAAVIIHRFGSKHRLLVALIDSAIDHEGAGVELTEVVNIRQIRSLAIDRFRAIDNAAAAANHLAQLGAELAQEELRGRLSELHRAVEANLTAAIQQAIDSNVLPSAPKANVAARIVWALADGTAFHWSARPSGQLRKRLRHDIDVVLDDWSKP